MNLKYFTQPEILQQIGSPRLAKLFDILLGDLKAGDVLLPTPESENGSYFDSLAFSLRSSPSLPERLQGTLFTLEAAVAPENASMFDDAIARRIPNVAVSQTCALDRALELWFHAPEELARFQSRTGVPPVSENSGTDPQSQSEAGLATPKPPSEDGLVTSKLSSEDGSPTERTSPHRASQSESECNNPTVQPCNPAVPNPPPSTLHAPYSDALPWHEPVDGNALLNRLVQVFNRFVVLPKWAAEALALWIVHTYAFHLRDVTAYIGIESPEMRCGKTTLLTLLSELAHRAVASSNISPPAFFRVIEDLSPTLLIDEVDTFLKGNDQLRGILNAGYHRKTAFVMRIAPSPTDPATLDTSPSSSLARFSCWCPKAMAKIGRFPDTIADRCILIRMQRKTQQEQCERSQELDPTSLKQMSARFVLDHAAEIASARPHIPQSLNDRAADIWEPLLALADLAGGDWPDRARQAAVGLSASTQEKNPATSLLSDIFLLFNVAKADRLFTRALVHSLGKIGERPWFQIRGGKQITEIWLANQLRPYGVRPRTIWIDGEHAKGYLKDDFMDAFRRYIPSSDFQALSNLGNSTTPVPSPEPQQ